MKFLKAIKKLGEQKPELKRVSGETVSHAGGKFAQLVPELLEDANVRIGRDSNALDFAGGSDEPTVHEGEIRTSGPSVVPQSRSKSFPTVTVDGTKVNRHLVAITDPDSAFCEEYRNLRATLLQKSKKQKLRTIVVVSTMPSEGKSVTALNLAWLIAQTGGINVLVIDCDLRVPSLTKYLGIEFEIGLSDVLDGTGQLEDAIVRLQPSNLNLLPGGLPRSDVAEQFSSPAFAVLLERVQCMFDFVIMDAPPLSVFADAKVVMNQADGSILVIRSNYTKYKDVDRVLGDLAGQRVLGVVLNRSEETLISGKYYDHPYYQNYRNRF